MKRSITLLVALAFLVACGFSAISAPQGDAKKGEAVYAKHNCKLCHSIAGVGNKKSPLDGVGSKLNEEQLKKWVRVPKEMNPKTTMLAYPAAKMPDGELADIVAYMLALKK